MSGSTRVPDRHSRSGTWTSGRPHRGRIDTSVVPLDGKASLLVLTVDPDAVRTDRRRLAASNDELEVNHNELSFLPIGPTHLVTEPLRSATDDTNVLEMRSLGQGQGRRTAEIPGHGRQAAAVTETKLQVRGRGPRTTVGPGRKWTSASDAGRSVTSLPFPVDDLTSTVGRVRDTMSTEDTGSTNRQQCLTNHSDQDTVTTGQ